MTDITPLTQIQELVAMLHGLTARVLETQDFSLMLDAKLELERITKLNIKQLDEAIDEIAMNALANSDNAEMGKYSIVVYQSERFALDNKKLRDAYSSLSDDDFKNMFYSHSTGKKSWKIKK